MMLERTHPNRWVARERRDLPALGMITLVNPGEPVAVFRTVALRAGSDERLLLRDCDALEVAFALLLAHTVRSRAARAGEAAVEEEFDEQFDEDEAA